MIIDLDNTNNLLLKSNKPTLKKGLEYFSKITSENIRNAFYNLTRTTNLKDIDIKFIITFLLKTRHLEFYHDKIYKRIPFDSNLIIDELIFFYYSILANNKLLNTELFVNSNFTINQDNITLDVFSIHIKYRVYFTILQNLELLIKTDKNGIAIIKSYALAKKFLERPLKKISPEEFKKEQEQNRIYGEEAEKFVLNFEFARLNEQKEIDWVAEYIINEGFDIASYNHELDELPNRFIEVKSYDGETPYFFWSRNEYSVAKRKKDDYWLYLVNRSEMNKTEYVPIMIQNPYEEILSNDEKWDKQIEKYKIELLTIR